MELGTYPGPIQAVLQELLEAASPSAQVPLHWRYSLMSLAVLLFIMPPVDAASAQVKIIGQPEVPQWLSGHTGTCEWTVCQVNQASLSLYLGLATLYGQ